MGGQKTEHYTFKVVLNVCLQRRGSQHRRNDGKCPGVTCVGAGGVAGDEEVPVEMEDARMHWDKESWHSHFGKEANRRAGERVGKDRRLQR